MTNYSHYNRTTFGLGVGLGTRVGTRVDRIYQCVCAVLEVKADEKPTKNGEPKSSARPFWPNFEIWEKKMIYCVRGVTGSGHACDLCCVQGDKRDLIRLTTVPDAGNSKLQVGFPAYIACFRLLKNGLGACCYQCAAR